jgi:hypothetical protein
MRGGRIVGRPEHPVLGRQGSHRLAGHFLVITARLLDHRAGIVQRDTGQRNHVLRMPLAVAAIDYPCMRLGDDGAQQCWATTVARRNG